MRVEHITASRIGEVGGWNAPVVMAMPALDVDTAQRCATLMASRAGAVDDGLVLIVIDDAAEGFIRIVNRVFARSACEYFGYVAEDAFPGRAWLQLALLSMRHRRAKLLAFNDGKWFGKLASFGLTDSAWVSGIYQRAFFYPGYRQHYADYELSRIAQHQGVFAFEPASVLIEIDWHKDAKRPNAQDKALFLQRQASAFDGLTRQ